MVGCGHGPKPFLGPQQRQSPCPQGVYTEEEVDKPGCGSAWQHNWFWEGKDGGAGTGGGECATLTLDQRVRKGLPEQVVVRPRPELSWERAVWIPGKRVAGRGSMAFPGWSCVWRTGGCVQWPTRWEGILFSEWVWTESDVT